MYDISLTCCTTYLCNYLLSLLEQYQEDTTWIRYTWSKVLFNNSWCVYKCLEIINREHHTIPPEDCEQFHIRRITWN